MMSMFPFNLVYISLILATTFGIGAGFNNNRIWDTL